MPSPAFQPPPSIDVPVEMKKADFARRYIKDQGQTGVLPVELFKAFDAAGMKIKRSYLYSLLQRLVEQHEVSQDASGRYIPTIRTIEP